MPIILRIRNIVVRAKNDTCKTATSIFPYLEKEDTMKKQIQGMW